MAHFDVPAFLPLKVDTAFESDRGFSATTNGMMTTLGYRGREQATGETMAWFGCDIATSVRSAMSKEEQELRDVESALKDLLRDPGLPVLRSLVPGPRPNHPPDVIATLSDGPLACETFQLHMPSSGRGNNVPVSRQARFDRLRQELMKHAANLTSRTRKHKGYALYVWFGDPGDAPDDRLPDKDATRLIDLLRNTSPPSKPAPPWKSSGTAPEDHIAWNHDKSLGLTWSKLDKGYHSPFLTSLHFELALAYGFTIRESDILSELRRLAEQHDSAATDLLVASVNVSYRSGLFFPSDQVLADMIFEAEDPLGTWVPQHVKRIVLHDPAQPGRHRWLLGSAIR